MNRGQYKCPVDVWQTDKVDGTNETDALGEKIQKPKKIAESLFVKIESRAGSLLSGRPADTVMSKVTHKISYPYQNLPIRLLNTKHWIEYKGIKFNIEYFLNEGFEDTEAQVFVSEKI